MIQTRNYVTVDFQGKEIPSGHLRPFNLTANDGDIHQYATDCIIAHWHQEMEVFISTQGQVRIGIEDQEYLVNMLRIELYYLVIYGRIANLNYSQS